MDQRGLLIDSDIFVLLSGAGMLDPALGLLGIDPSCAYRLDALLHMVRKGKRFAQLRNPDTVWSVEQDCHRIASIQEPPTNHALECLTACPDIDYGEALLYATLAEHASYLLTTGDNRSLHALATDKTVQTVRNQVAGRIICLETLLRGLIVKFGVSRVAKAFSIFPDHKSLQIHFSSLKAEDQDSCLASLDSYLAHYCRTYGDGFLLEL